MSWPACTSAVPNHTRSACSSSTTRNSFPGQPMTSCRSIRSRTVSCTSLGMPRNSIQNDAIAAQYSGVWSRPGMTLCS